MAKQDTIADHPYQTEKDSAASGACKDKQLRRKDPVDVTSLSVSELPSNARHLDSSHPSRRSSPQAQLQSSSHHPRPPSGSSPTQSLLLLQEHPPSKNTSSNKPSATSPAGVKADKSLNDPLTSNFTAALAVDLDLTSVATLNNSHQHTRTNAGLARWHSWVIEQTRNNEFTDNVALHTGNRDSVLEITPSAVIHYLEDVVLPLEQASYSMISDSTADTTNMAESGKGATSVIEIYLMPVLQLWQHQYQLQEKQRLGHQQQQQRRQLEQPCRHADPSSSSSSVTMSSELKSLHEGISDDRATVANGQYTTRQQDQLLRLIRLEKSHQNTALVISQLQDQVQRLIDERAHHTKYKLQSCQDKDHNILPASDNEPESNGSVSLAAMSGRHTSKRPYSPSTRQRLQRQQQQQQQTGGYYGGKGESHRAEELIEVIARGLEEYHARAANERTRQSSGTDTTTAAHDHPSWQHIDSLNENVLGHSHHPQSPHDRAVDYHYEQEALDRSSGSQQHSSNIYYGEQSPSQHSHHSYHHQRHKHKQQQVQAQQMQAELQQDDLLEVPPHHSLNDRPVRSRKRSSSMGGPGGVHKENIKQARSCSPPRPRTTPDKTQTRLDGSAVIPVAAVGPNGHTSQAPIIPVGKSVQESRLDGHLNSSKSNVSIDVSASSTAAASLAMLHYGSVDRARQHSVSPHHTDYHTHQQPAHPYTTSAQRLQEQNGKVSDRYPSHPPQDNAFNYTPSQITRVAPPPYGEDDYRSYSDHPLPPLRHHSHPSQSYSHIEDIALESVEPAGDDYYIYRA
ncbi:MAG: hypothetical protein J3R72DRAFT_426119 [Linnemannia gamsii]|nr:MAG: hypothetical protein J3R72DRAFT_426119 [Linnemannia gamsii]